MDQMQRRSTPEGGSTASGSEAARQARAALTSPWFLAVGGAQAGLVHALPPGQVVVGRGALLHDPALSRRHLELEVSKRSVRLAAVPGHGGARWCWRLPNGHLMRGRQVRVGQRWTAGRALRCADTTFTLRPQPHLYRPREPVGSRLQRLLRAITMLMPLVLVGVLGWTLWQTWRGSTHSGNRMGMWPLGMMTAIPMALMMLTRMLGSTGKASGVSRRPRTRGPFPLRRAGSVVTGWRGRQPDAAGMLLLLARVSRVGHEAQEWRVWGLRRGARHVLSVTPGDVLALDGTAQAARALQWWIATQLTVRGVATARIQGEGLILSPAASARPEPGPAESEHVRVGRAEDPSIRTQATAIVRCRASSIDLSPAWQEGANTLILAQQSEHWAASRTDNEGSEEGLPEQWLLQEILPPPDPDVCAWRWREPPTTLPALLGRSARGEVLVDLVTEGPHALIAGTTGAGKSQFLTCWLLQLAQATPPWLLSLVLVDYKGGAAFRALENLPHTAGVLTDLDPALTHRALASLEAELGRRERLVARHQVSDVGDLPAGKRPARIVIAVDEFAVLAQSHPDVLDALMRVAAQGRSLGMHLILATQRPHGAVSPAMRANTAIRICLRVLDEAESRDVLGHSGAARLSPVPGRFLLDSSSASRCLAAQAPWSGGNADVAQRVSAIAAVVTAPRSGDGGVSPPRPWRPWAPPLPTRITAAQASHYPPHAASSTTITARETSEPSPTQGRAEQGRDAHLTVGLLDDPEHQRLARLDWDGRVPLLILAAAGSGGSTAALTAALQELTAEHPRPVHLCGVSAQDRQRWALLQPDEPGLGTVVGAEDPRRLTRLWHLATQGRLTGSLLILDRVDQLLEAVDRVRGPGQGGALLEDLCRNASHLGLGLLLVAPPNCATRPWAAHIRQRLILGVSDPAQAALAGVSRGHIQPALPGRGLASVNSAWLPCQLCLPEPYEDAPVRSGAARATGHAPLILRPLPQHVRNTEVAHPVWAVGGDEASPLALPPGSVLIAGPPGSGRSTALRALAQAYAAEGLSPRIVDDLERAPASTHSTIEQALACGELILAATTTQAAASAYRGVLAALKERASLLLLWPSLGPASQISPVDLRDAVDPSGTHIPGRGVYVQTMTATAVQVALPACEDHNILSA